MTEHKQHQVLLKRAVESAPQAIEQLTEMLKLFAVSSQ